MAMSVISPIASGIRRGFVLTEIVRQEDNNVAKKGFLLVATNQFFEVLCAKSYVNQALTMASCRELPLAGRVVLYLTPPLLAYAASMKIQNSVVRSVVHTLHAHIGTLCQIAVVVSSVAMIILGSPILGVTSLAVLGIGLLDRKGLLPSRVSHFLHNYSFPILAVTTILSGHYIEGVICIVIEVAFRFFNRKQSASALPAPVDRKNFLDADKLLEFLSNPKPLAVNEEHYRYPIATQSPDVRDRLLQELQNERRAIVKEYIEALREESESGSIAGFLLWPFKKEDFRNRLFNKLSDTLSLGQPIPVDGPEEEGVSFSQFFLSSQQTRISEVFKEECYTTDAVVKVVKDEIGNLGSRYQTWWEDWLGRQDIERVGECSEALRGAAESRKIQAMLMDMGILI